MAYMVGFWRCYPGRDQDKLGGIRNAFDEDCSNSGHIYCRHIFRSRVCGICADQPASGVYAAPGGDTPDTSGGLDSSTQWNTPHSSGGVYAASHWDAAHAASWLHTTFRYASDPSEALVFI